MANNSPTKWTVSKLRKYAENHSINTSGVIEKKNLVEKVQKYMESISGSSAAGAAASSSSPAAAAAAAAAASSAAAAANSGRKVNVLLLGEEHESVECAISLIKKIQGFVVGKGSAFNGSEFLAVSEGRPPGNACFNTGIFKLPKQIFEYEENFSDSESILTLVLDLELLIALADGKKPTYPNGKPITATYFTEHLSAPFGYRNLLGKYNLIRDWQKVAVLASLGKEEKKGEVLTILDTVFTTIIKGIQDGTDKTLQQLIPYLEMLVESRYDRAQGKTITKIINTVREQEFSAKILRAIESDPAIKKVIIIMGDLHYRPLKNLLEKSPLIVFDKQSNAYYPGHRGGRRMKSTRKARKGTKGKTKRNRRT